jgi:uncharacterized Zn finger protein (UPF0148 family)
MFAQSRRYHRFAGAERSFGSRFQAGLAMKCPFCSHAETQVVETRLAEDASFIRRRRKCPQCEKRFTTYERPEVSFPAVVKKDGRRIEYATGKLRDSFALALRKRPSAPSRWTPPSNASKKSC